MRNYIIAGLLAATLATPALAQDDATQTAGPMTGIRVGAIAGYDRPEANGGSTDGVLYGISAGYDHQVGNVVAGVEFEATDTTAGECENDVLEDGDEICASFKRDLYAGFRIGGVINDTALVYFKAGYSNQRVGASVDLVDEDRISESANLDGFRVGGGVEAGFGANFFVKGEYRYSNYQDEIQKHQGVVGVGFRF